MDAKTEGVSFVVTAYNKERYLEATLKSILAQEGDLEREFIVVDDGSSDRSVEIAEDLIGSLANGKVIQQSNGCPGKAQNTGVAAATLPTIKFLDGDDLLPPDAVSHMLPGLQLPGVALFHGDGRVLEKPDDDLRIDRDGKPATFEVMKNPLYYSIRHSLAGASALMVDKKAYLDCDGCDVTVFT